ncbi:allantoinase AllB [Mycolicibacterium sp. BiH015]|uniref:allantoinase AllB n=1 Tax=Mycolicibacterium sp. BiH015 TaxID=3018808 RepID=UPI0022E3F7BB|nr:allantoinase AllB [Mycolicibacterium sp. BiH015]MDA2894562.1 allantoinase AllB [Mycolicibacterium sp. BiH015]
MTELVLRGDRVLVDGQLRPASVAVVDGVIAALGARDADHGDTEEIDLPPQAVLLPGFVDSHVHINEPGTDWEGFATATAAAAAAGITTLVDMPLDCVPVTTSVSALKAKTAAAQNQCLVDVAYWAGVVPGNIGKLTELAAAGVAGFKCFLTDSGNPDFAHLSPDELRIAMAEIAELRSVLLVHAECHDVIADSPPPDGSGYASFLASRPDEAEVEAVRLVVDSARESGVRVHIVHVSSARALPIIADARASGVTVTAETCPHYLTFTAEDVPDGGTEFASCPPIRPAPNRELLWAGLSEGTLDMVVSDHSPCAPECKGGGDFAAAFGGISSLQLGPRVLWTQAQARGFGLPDLSRWMSARPAALAGFADRGAIRPGMRADLCTFEPDTRETVRGSDLLHRHGVTPYEGMPLRGKVVQTWVAGRTVYEHQGAAA